MMANKCRGNYRSAMNLLAIEKQFLVLRCSFRDRASKVLQFFIRSTWVVWENLDLSGMKVNERWAISLFRTNESKRKRKLVGGWSHELSFYFQFQVPLESFEVWRWTFYMLAFYTRTRIYLNRRNSLKFMLLISNVFVFKLFPLMWIGSKLFGGKLLDRMKVFRTITFLT